MVASDPDPLPLTRTALVDSVARNCRLLSSGIPEDAKRTNAPWRPRSQVSLFHGPCRTVLRGPLVLILDFTCL